MLPLTSWLPAMLLALPLAAAQVKTDCDPMEKDCPNDPALGITHHFHFNATPPHDVWEKTASGAITYDADRGAVFTLAKQGESPTLRSKFYFFGGRSEMLMKCAPGRGVISSMMWLSDTLDEVDWEFFGTNATSAASNYFGKGDKASSDGEYHTTDFNIYDDYHNYTTVWTEEKLEWWIDGKLVRTLLPNDAQGGKFFPQTPMRLHLGVWAGGDPEGDKGTIEWAGGETDFGEGPFEMAVKSIKISDFSEGSKEYIYGDRSGMWDSIEIVEGNSTAVEAIFREPDLSLSEKWAALPQAARIGVYAGAAGLVALIAVGGLWYFFRQRRRGAREADAAALRAAHEHHELSGMDAKVGAGMWKPGDSEYSVAEVRGDGSVEKVFAGMGPRPDNSWPEEAHAAPLLGGGGQSPPRGGQGYERYEGHGYGPQSPPRGAAEGYRYGQQSPPQEYGYGGPGHGGYR